jgi:nitrogenase molybdenum-iron protein NifN
MNPVTPAIEPRLEATRNACKLCTPLGACLVFRGIRGAMPFLHGSQGCATYIRRYVISHFREPMDIASSNFSEGTAVFGGGENLTRGLDNVIRQYHPELIGIATTCLSETIGEDVPGMLRAYATARAGSPDLPALVHVSTASYRGTHMHGFHDAVRATVAALACQGATLPRQINLLPGLVSPADLRHLREIVAAFGLQAVVLPDYADTLDGPAWDDYQALPDGGTSCSEIATMGQSLATVQFGRALALTAESAADRLQATCAVPACKLGLPIGLRETDALFDCLARLSRQAPPEPFVKERGRLVDAYVDGHKYLAGKRAVLYGEEDLVVGLAAFLTETGIVPVLAASGGKSGVLRQTLTEAAPETASKTQVVDDADFVQIEAAAKALQPDLVIGHSKGAKLARALDIPLVRAGFPIHDRFGGQRLHHLGYRGTQELYDRIVNALLEKTQTESDIGYSYM